MQKFYDFSKHDSIAYADEDFQDCMDDFATSSSNHNNVRNKASKSSLSSPIHAKDTNLSNGPSNAANSVAIQTGQSSDASTQTVNDPDVKNNKSSKSSCIIA